MMPPPVTNEELFHPEGPCGHKLLTVRPDEISVITTKTLKISADLIVDDVKKHQIPRFRWVLITQ